MFIGKYYHALETKGRLSLPKTFRTHHTEWVVTRGLDGGLFLIPQATFESELVNLNAKPFTRKNTRDYIRLMVNDAHSVVPDKSGRVQLPEHLIALAGLEKRVVVVGSISKVEIWAENRYHAYVDSLSSEFENLAENIAQEASNE
jgi:MraZ protein